MTDDDLPEWARDKDPDELLAILEGFVEIFRKRHEHAVLEGLEQSFPDTPSFSWPPAPLTAHPALECNAETVRALMRRGEHTICTYKPRSIKWMYEPEPDLAEVRPSDNIITLTVREAWHPAPYVGEPYVIVWPVALDNLNRFVAGEPRTEFTHR